MTTAAPANLRQALSMAFSFDELNLLCSDAGVNPDNIPLRDRGLDVWAGQMLIYFLQRNLLSRLIDCAQQRVSAIHWQALLDDFIHAPARGLVALSELMEVPAVRDLVAGARVRFETARAQLRLMTEYKEVHDTLQQLELDHGVMTSLVYEQGRLKDAQAVNWREFPPKQVACLTTMEKVQTAVTSASFAADESRWIADLQRAGEDMQAALDDRDASRYAGALDAIYDVIDRQTPRVNDRLIAAVDALRMGDLISTLKSILQNAMVMRDMLDALAQQNLDAFGRDIATLDGEASLLVQLRNEHDVLQRFDDDLRVEQAQVDLDPHRFAARWQRLRRRADDLAPQLNPVLAAQLASHALKLESALAGNPDDSSYRFMNYRSAVVQRFNKVDRDLKILCGKLNDDASSLLDSALNKLGQS